MDRLSPTAKVILGMLEVRPRSGYEIKQFVDRSTRFFWAASYGQIYPELQRLAEAGLIEGADQSTGDRRRTVYRLTGSGEQALLEWLREPPETYELRHEGMLKAFFADALPPAERAQRLLDLRDQHAAKLAELREVEAAIPPEWRASSQYLVLRLGIEWNEWIAGWCERAARELDAAGAERTGS